MNKIKLYIFLLCISQYSLPTGNFPAYIFFENRTQEPLKINVTVLSANYTTREEIRKYWPVKDGESEPTTTTPPLNSPTTTIVLPLQTSTLFSASIPAVGIGLQIVLTPPSVKIGIGITVTDMKDNLITQFNYDIRSPNPGGWGFALFKISNKITAWNYQCTIIPLPMKYSVGPQIIDPSPSTFLNEANASSIIRIASLS